jgi:hypothetical protein
VIGLGLGENFIGSYIQALLPVTNRFIYLENGDTAQISRYDIALYDVTGASVERDIVQSNASMGSCELGEYRHFMHKEIFEQPQAIQATLDGRTSAICIHNNNKIFYKKNGYKSLKDIPSNYKPPLHYNCRSILIEVDDFILKNITRASAKGQVSFDTDFTSFYNRNQKFLMQNLGIKKGLLIKRGLQNGLNIRDFIVKDVNVNKAKWLTNQEIIKILEQFSNQ